MSKSGLPALTNGMLTCAALQTGFPKHQNGRNRRLGFGNSRGRLRTSGYTPESRRSEIASLWYPASRFAFFSKEKVYPNALMTALNATEPFRHPAEIISHVVWLYFRFSLSYRDIEELMASRGIFVSYEAIPHAYFTARINCSSLSRSQALAGSRSALRCQYRYHSIAGSSKGSSNCIAS